MINEIHTIFPQFISNYIYNILFLFLIGTVYSFYCVLMVNMGNVQNSLIQEGKEMASVLYTYRSCVKALPQVNFYFGFENYCGLDWLLRKYFLLLKKEEMKNIHITCFATCFPACLGNVSKMLLQKVSFFFSVF